MTIHEFIQKSFRFITNHIFCSNKQMTIVTGANDEYFETLMDNLLDSIRKYEPCSFVVVWDLGLKLVQREFILEKYPHVELRSFDFSKYPEHYTLSRQSYAWKSACIYETCLQCKCELLFWLDAGCKLKGHLNSVRKVLQLYGFYSPYSRTTVEEMTYKSVLDSFSFLSKGSFNKRMLAGGIVGVDINSKLAKSIIWEWWQFSKDSKMIIPEGSNRENHRQDQSLLSLIYYKHRNDVPLLAQRYYDFLSHQRKDNIFIQNVTNSECV